MTEARNLPAVGRLLQEALTLQALLSEAGSAVPAAMTPSVEDRKAIVDLYIERLKAAMNGGTPTDLVKACNAFTTVNKGLADAPWIDDFPQLSRQALTVSHQAWDAGDEARRIAGQA